MDRKRYKNGDSFDVYEASNSTKGRDRNPSTSSKLKGFHKKRATLFKKGTQLSQTTISDSNEVHPSDIQRPCVRHSEDYFNAFAIKTVSNEFSVPGADGSDGNAIVLRPRRNRQEPCDEREPSSGCYNIFEEGNILVEKSRILELINQCNIAHKDLGVCDSMKWDLVDFIPWGLFSSTVLTCINCGFRSDRTKMYEEVHSDKQGRKAAVGNIRLQLLLQDLPIGPTELQLIFAAVGLRVGSLSGMQKAAYKAADSTEQVATADMEKWRQYTKQVLADRGVKNFDEISAQFDVRYHGMFRACAKTPGPGAQQATATCVETVTPQKKCIAIDHINKACPKGSRMKGKGMHVFCGEGGQAKHMGCTATQSGGHPIHEYDMAERMAEDILSTNNLSVTHLCTDSDATGKNAFQAVNDYSGKTLPDLTWYKDPSHVSRNMKKHILAHTFHSGTFGCKTNGSQWNYKERLDCRKALSLDIPERVALTLRAAHDHWKGDTVKIRENSESLSGYMMRCYTGDHSSCQTARLAKLTGCRGKGQSRNWFSKSSSLSAQGITCLHLNEDDKAFLESVIDMKLGKEAVDFFTRRATTSRCESINRAISKSCPKNRLFSRISKSRVCSAIGRQNNSFKDFTHMKFRAMKCSMRPGSIGEKIIRKYQRKRDLTYQSQKKASFSIRRHILQAERRKKYFIERLKTTNEAEYHKHKLDVVLKAKNSALDAINKDDPVPSTSMEDHIGQAANTAIHMKDTLRQAKRHSIRTVRSNLRVQRHRRKAAKKRCEEKHAARVRGPAASLRIRNEHSYGLLY